MNNSVGIKIIWIAALLFLFAGVIMTVHNLNRSKTTRERMNKQLGELRILRNQEADLARHEAARREYEQVADKKPVPLSKLLQETMEGIKVDDVRESRKDLVDGWSVRQKEISMSEVSLGRVIDFINKAESQKLPWSLARFTVRTAPRIPGSGQVVLVMECLEKTD